MNKKLDSRDVGIEFARILGCLIVIGVHIGLGDMIDGVYDPSRGLINCFLADGVAIFWLICGCFLFRSASYKKVLMRTSKTIALPLAIYSIFCLFFARYIIFGGPIIQCVYTSFGEYFKGFMDAISLNQTIPLTGHLWYCYAYILVMLSFPILKAFVQWMDEDKKRQFWFCFLSFICFIINDLTFNQSLAFSHHGLNAAVPAAIEIVWGSILYRNKERLLKCKFIWVIAGVAFIVLNVLRMFSILKTGNRALLYWYSSIGLLCGLCVVIFACVVGCWLKNQKVLSSLTLWLANNTFFIYLIHVLFISLLTRFNINNILFNGLSLYTDGFLLECLYTISLIIFVFLLSLMLSLILKLLIWSIKYMSKIMVIKLIRKG